MNRVPDGEHGRHYTRHGYAETRRHEQDGFRRVFFRKPVS